MEEWAIDFVAEDSYGTSFRDFHNFFKSVFLDNSTSWVLRIAEYKVKCCPV